MKLEAMSLLMTDVMRKELTKCRIFFKACHSSLLTPNSLWNGVRPSDNNNLICWVPEN